MESTPKPYADLEEAYDVFATLVASLDRAQLALPTVNDGWTVRDVANHVVDGDHWAGEQLRTGCAEFSDTDYVQSGRAIDAVTAGRQSFTFALNERHTAHHSARVASEDIDPAEIVAIRIDELIGHGWDIAQATGQDTDIAPRLAERCLERLRTELAKWGSRGEFYKPAQPVAPDAPIANQLAAFAGKRVTIRAG